ncbi:dehydrogenase (zinc-binding alcohol dehydrogenase, NADPH quinone oxidoreductase, oxidoreductase) [Fulvimarina pelagi HTCC2506]|uniref:Dehydrogenase (Zinc-binding alcohol dehydrogenase, NADPH quinone oxidoreductase, oxidoreductase) n=1 Tax=Fulvimarina pelagi HTCC2506 TaxID=314231 RepID=Q0G1V3_9HYPH|nr:MDR family oxidoreductase [Fulvimarina pelagi]EAU41445.1 dehydrogenase (zinc-binding alcohol dehydrogenase, NADPH quinone oxidoreductase, oxidoreductase) [Fulvimarina pelagi HTCC2506]
MADTFRAVLISRDEDKNQSVEMTELTMDDLMEGDVDIRVEASTINYKDGLAITGKSPIVRRWPMIPGIDLAGEVIESRNAEWKPGDKVVLNGWGLSETHYGGYSERARVKGEWLVKLPDTFSVKEAMAIGTAGYTAMLSVLALEDAGSKPEDGPVIVSGATGGVGSVAVSVLSKLGWNVIAVTGRSSESQYLKDLGATEIMDREELSEKGKPLEKERWAAGVDCAGSHTLVNMLAGTKRHGSVAACGLAQGFDLPATVMPFILRGVSLHGIDSVMAPKPRREQAWQRLSSDLDKAKLTEIASEVSFDQVIETAKSLIDGKVRGRVVVDI